MPLPRELVGDQLLVRLARFDPDAPLQFVQFDQIEAVEDVAQSEILGRHDARAPERRSHLGRFAHAARSHVGDRGQLLAQGALRSRRDHGAMQVRLALQLVECLEALVGVLQGSHGIEALEGVAAIIDAAFVKPVRPFDVSGAPAVLAIDGRAADQDGQFQSAAIHLLHHQRHLPGGGNQQR